MLYSSLISLMTIGLSLTLINDAIASTVINSNDDYVPKELRVVSALSQNQNNADKKLNDTFLTETQKKGMNEGRTAVESMLKTKSNDNQTLLVNEIVNRNQQIINDVYQKASLGEADKNDPALYYFVSSSMPDAIIKSYLLDAIWNGGTVVVRGIPKGMTISQFLQQFIMPLVRYKGDHAKIEINPNLYEMYDVQVVPTILITKGKAKENQCERTITISVDSKVNYQSCKKVDPLSYWKLSGNVTTRWALNILKEAGAPVDLFINRMQPLNHVTQKEEKGFRGDWQNIPLPTTDNMISAILEKYGLQQTHDGVITKKNDDIKPA